MRQVSSISQDGESEEDVKVLEQVLSRRLSHRKIKPKNGKKKEKKVSCFSQQVIELYEHSSVFEVLFSIPTLLCVLVKYEYSIDIFDYYELPL